MFCLKADGPGPLSRSAMRLYSWQTSDRHHQRRQVWIETKKIHALFLKVFLLFFVHKKKIFPF